VFEAFFVLGDDNMILRAGLVYVTAAIALLFATHAPAVTLTVGDAMGGPGESVQITIEVDDPSQIAGVAFTMVYDTGELSLEAVDDSSFFDLFVKGPETAGLGTPVSGALRAVGAARKTLLVLRFRIKTDTESASGEVTGDYPIAIVPSRVSLTEAGYTTVVSLPFVTGLDPGKDPFAQPGEAFPVLTLAAEAGVLAVDRDRDGLSDTREAELGTDKDLADSDNDGMPDGWEVSHHLDPKEGADALTDGDGDGYSNLREYLSGTNPEDPEERPGLIGDLDGDGDADGGDLALLASGFGIPTCSTETTCAGDLDADKDVDLVDLHLMTEDFGRR
jgi:hypothetical protein